MSTDDDTLFDHGPASGNVHVPAPEAGWSQRARTSDPDTSFEAAASVTNISGKQRDVLRVLASIAPATDDVLVSTYERVSDVERQSQSGIRTRRAELAGLGRPGRACHPPLVRDTGERRKLGSGRNAIVWDLTEAGRETLS